MVHPLSLRRLQNLLRVPWPVTAVAFGLLVPAPALAQPAVEWTTFADEAGTRVEYPRDVFPVIGHTTLHTGRVFETSDGRAQLHVFTMENRDGESPARFLGRRRERDRSRLAYSRVTASFFAISAVHEGRILYRRCNFPYRGAHLVHCMDVRYPAEEKRAWDDIVTRISLSLRPGA